MALKRLQSAIPNLDRVQSYLRTILDPIDRNPLLKGTLLEGIVLDSSDPSTSIEHKLGREYQGFFVTAKNAAADVYETTSTDRTKYILLVTTQDVTVDVWVF